MSPGFDLPLVPVSCTGTIDSTYAGAARRGRAVIARMRRMVLNCPVSSVSTQVPYVYISRIGENYTDPEMRSLHAVGSDSAARARPEFHTATDRVRQNPVEWSVV